MKELIRKARKIATNDMVDMLIVYSNISCQFIIIDRYSLDEKIHEAINLITPDGTCWCGPTK